MGHEAHHHHEVELSLSEDRVGDVDIARGAGVTDSAGAVTSRKASCSA